jgi:hypothetical protein
MWLGYARMDEILSRLQVMGYDARTVGTEIHVTSHRVPLIISANEDHFSVRAVAGSEVTRVCYEPDEVIAEVKGWRS